MKSNYFAHRTISQFNICKTNHTNVEYFTFEIFRLKLEIQFYKVWI